MFFCDDCAKENGWPKSSARWNSVCEVCDVLRECSDIPSRALPDPTYKGDDDISRPHQ